MAVLAGAGCGRTWSFACTARYGPQSRLRQRCRAGSTSPPSDAPGSSRASRPVWKSPEVLSRRTAPSTSPPGDARGAYRPMCGRERTPTVTVMDADHPIWPLPDMRPPRVRRLPPAQVPAAVAVVAAGMRDNPIHVAAYGADPHQRQSQHGRVIGGLLRVSALTLTGVTRGDALVAVMGEALPGVCRLTVRQRLRMVPTLVSMGRAPPRGCCAGTAPGPTTTRPSRTSTSALSL